MLHRLLPNTKPACQYTNLLEVAQQSLSLPTLLKPHTFDCNGDNITNYHHFRDSLSSNVNKEKI